MPCRAKDCDGKKCGGYVSSYREADLGYCAKHIFDYSCRGKSFRLWWQYNIKFYGRVGKHNGIIFMLTLIFIDLVQRTISITNSWELRKFFHTPESPAVGRKRIDSFVLVMFFSSIIVYASSFFSIVIGGIVIPIIFVIWDIYIGVEEWGKLSLILIYPTVIVVTLWDWVAYVLISFRILTILTMHMGTLLYSKHHFRSPERSILLATLNYFECIFWFGVIYLTIDYQFEPCLNDCPFSALYYSMVTITTLGYGDIEPIGWLARMISGSEAIIGVFFIAVVIGYFLSHLSGERK